jgi:mycothiol synthase
MIESAVVEFLEQVEAESGVPALSEAKLFSLAGRAMSVVVTEDDRILGIGAAARHTNAGGVHHALETAVVRSMQFAEFEEAVASAALALVPDGPTSFWSTRDTLDVALARLGFRPRRTLLYMAVDLPLVDAESRFRSMRPGEEEGLIHVNNAAFASHREAGHLTHSDLETLRAEPWFDPEGILVAVDEGRMIGFCWTKVHPGGEGEIYRIAVDPGAQGGGLGRRLVLAGFDHLATERGVETGTLWVDEANSVAVDLYESIGMRSMRRNREFERND